MTELEQALIIAAASFGGLLLLFLFTLATGCAPRWVLSLVARLMRVVKKRKKWNWTTIEPGLILGTLPRWPCHLEELRTEGVGAVLTLNEPWELSLSSQCVQDCNMVSRHLPTPDFFAPSQRDIVEAVNFINSCLHQGMSIYVHCNGGKGRSAVCVICYLIYVHDWSPDEAFKFVKGKRKIAGMKAWGGLHKQWRAVKRFARELKATRKQMAYTVPGETQAAPLAAKTASAKVAPLQGAVPQFATGADDVPTAPGPPGVCSDADCEAQIK